MKRRELCQKRGDVLIQKKSKGEKNRKGTDSRRMKFIIVVAERMAKYMNE